MTQLDPVEAAETADTPLPFIKPGVEEQFLDEMSNLESDMAHIDIACQRNRLFALRGIFSKRHQLILRRMPDFWATIFHNAPAEVAQFIDEDDIGLLTSITKFFVERFEITDNGADGEPRSIRFTFEFEENPYFENPQLVKEFRYRTSTDGKRCGLVSDPIHVKWKTQQMDLTDGCGLKAWLLFQAENAVREHRTGGGTPPTRQQLWQNQRVLQALKLREEGNKGRLGFFSFFYYRGPDLSDQVAGEGSITEEKEEEEVYSGDASTPPMDIEICPRGADMANFLADHLWEDAFDHYVKSLEPDDEVEDDDAMANDSEDLPMSPRPILASVTRTLSKPKAQTQQDNSSETPATKKKLDPIEEVSEPNREDDDGDVEM